MATAANIIASQAQTKASLAALQTSVGTLTADYISPADAQTILANDQANGAVAVALNTTVTAALGSSVVVAPPPPSGPAPTV